MFGKRFELFTVFGFPIRIDLSWFLVAVLVAWSLSASYFPTFQPGLGSGVYWWMGLAGALGLFGSVILHELSHALVARRYGLTIRGITLFIFGGVAEMDSEPPSAVAEFAVAIAGPIASVGVAVTFFVLGLTGSTSSWPAPLNGVAWYLAMINGALALFNMLPAFPLDGGRVLRSVLWYLQGDLRSATRISAAAGAGLGFLLLAYGIFRVVLGDFIGGLWMFLIGIFLRNASQISFRRQEVHSGLAGLTVHRFLQADPVTVPRSIPIGELVENYIYRHRRNVLPVVSNDRLFGCVTLAAIKAVPREEWSRQSVGAIVESCSPTNSIGPDAPAEKALETMTRHRVGQLMVVSGDELLGVIALDDMLQFLALKTELEGH